MSESYDLGLKRTIENWVFRPDNGGNKPFGKVDPMYISTDIPAGNGVVSQIDGDRIVLKPDLRGNAQWWFYWHIAIREAAGRKLQLSFLDKTCIGPAGIAISQDAGLNWSWSETASGSEVEICVPENCNDLRVAMTMPYTLQDWQRATAGLSGLAHHSLCTSNGGRDVPMVSVGVKPNQAKAQVVITARHHCCESIASFVCDGFLRAWLSEPAAQPIREQTAFLLLPFADMDGVEQGDQGKFRAPYDHNRSYQSDRYAETVALRAFIEGKDRRNIPTFNLDLHCPYVRGHLSEHIYIVGSGHPNRAQEQQRFAALLAQGPGELLGFTANDFLAHGTAWNTAPVDESRSCASWFGSRSQSRLSASMEIPYGRTKGSLITAESARAFGKSLAVALAAYVDGEVD